eukprot:3858442-Prymnesium_polylepis.1
MGTAVDTALGGAMDEAREDDTPDWLLEAEAELRAEPSGGGDASEARGAADEKAAEVEEEEAAAAAAAAAAA